MIKCEAKYCLHNKENICTLENIKINDIYMCDNAKFEPCDNVFMHYSPAEEGYRKIKNMLTKESKMW